MSNSQNLMRAAQMLGVKAPAPAEFQGQVFPGRVGLDFQIAAATYTSASRVSASDAARPIPRLFPSAGDQKWRGVITHVLVNIAAADAADVLQLLVWDLIINSGGATWSLPLSSCARVWPAQDAAATPQALPSVGPRLVEVELEVPFAWVGNAGDTIQLGGVATIAAAVNGTVDLRGMWANQNNSDGGDIAARGTGGPGLTTRGCVDPHVASLLAKR